MVVLDKRWLHLYGDFIVKNANSVSQIESALRSLTYIIPGTRLHNPAGNTPSPANLRISGRFRDAEIASESLHSGIQLLSLYHDSLLTRAVARLPSSHSLASAKLSVPLSPSTPHNRYTGFWTQTLPLYKRVALTLQMIQYTELLWEMTAKRRGGEKTRWRVVVLLEAIKAICRFWLLRLTGSRPLVSPPLPEREVDPSILQGPEIMSDEPQPLPSQGSFANGWTMPRTGLTLPTLPLSHKSSDTTTYLLARVLTAEDIKPAPTLLHRITGTGQLAEILYILRPVVYALAMQHFSNPRTNNSGRSSWTPWLLGLSIEYSARQLAKRDFRESLAGGLRGMTGLEKEEMRRRAWALAWWAMRGAFYENFTKSWLNSMTRKLRGKPLLDMVGGVLEDYEFLWDNYHFSSATM
ncbi:MAG: Peroxisomal membrane protein pex16 [Caeruleum heppii]|nr:MAG: Peroxisomal membrane protein pex16 [Caeruleum heppii]